MKQLRLLLQMAALIFCVTWSTAWAGQFTLYIHGRSDNGTTTNNWALYIGNYAQWGAHEKSQVALWKGSLGPQPIMVNWDGRSTIAESNAAIRNALDCYCTGENSCYIMAHSAGNLQIGYALSHWGSSTRNQREPYKVKSKDSSGVDACQIKITSSVGDALAFPNASFPIKFGVEYWPKTQIGWNINHVSVAGGAAGGSELADASIGIPGGKQKWFDKSEQSR